MYCVIANDEMCLAEVVTIEILNSRSKMNAVQEVAAHRRIEPGLGLRWRRLQQADRNRLQGLLVLLPECYVREFERLLIARLLVDCHGLLVLGSLDDYLRQQDVRLLVSILREIREPDEIVADAVSTIRYLLESTGDEIDDSMGVGG